jgi:inner membrane protein
MDPLTHSSFGMALAMLVAKPDARRSAALVGLTAGLLPDADIFMVSLTDPLFSLEYHRHFTHSVAFSPVIMLLAAGIAGFLLRAFRRPQPFRSLLFPALVAVWSHIFCDLWTSYGTHVLWPFSQARSALDWVSVVDPLLTVPLLILTIRAVWKNKIKLVVYGLSWVALYLCGAVVQQQRAQSAMDQLAADADRIVERSAVKPSFGNILVWRAIYESQGVYYVAGIRCGWQVQCYGQSQVQKVQPPDQSAPWELPSGAGTLAAGSVQLADVARFAHFSDEWLAWHPTQPGVLGDMRYAQLPHQVAPLWGIKFDPQKPLQHVKIETIRRNDPEVWQELWRAICGDSGG